MVKRVTRHMENTAYFGKGPRAIQVGNAFVETATVTATGNFTNRTAAPFSGSLVLYVTSGGVAVNAGSPKGQAVQAITNLQPFTAVPVSLALGVTSADAAGPIKARFEVKDSAGTVRATKAEQTLADNKGTSELTLDISFGVG